MILFATASILELNFDIMMVVCAMSEWSFVEIFLLPSVLPLDTYKLMSLTIAGNKFTVS